MKEERELGEDKALGRVFALLEVTEYGQLLLKMSPTAEHLASTQNPLPIKKQMFPNLKHMFKKTSSYFMKLEEILVL